MPTLTPRHRAEIENLPPKYKWEVLRRHPHYIRDWRLARFHWMTLANPDLNDDERAEMEAAAVRMHQLTGGWDRVYPDPTTAADKLADGFLERQAGAENAITLTARRAIESIIWTLPPEAARAVGRILLGQGIDCPQTVVKCSAADGRDLIHQFLLLLCPFFICPARAETAGTHRSR
jgi:hypothetical protein